MSHYCITCNLLRCTLPHISFQSCLSLTRWHFWRQSRTHQLSLQPPCWATRISLSHACVCLCVCAEISLIVNSFHRACPPKATCCGYKHYIVCLLTVRSRRSEDKLALMMLLYMLNCEDFFSSVLSAVLPCWVTSRRYSAGIYARNLQWIAYNNKSGTVAILLFAHANYHAVCVSYTKTQPGMWYSQHLASCMHCYIIWRECTYFSACDTYHMGWAFFCGLKLG